MANPAHFFPACPARVDRKIARVKRVLDLKQMDFAVLEAIVDKTEIITCFKLELGSKTCC